MKLLKTIKKIIQEAEEQYNSVCEGSVNLNEIDRRKTLQRLIEIIETLQE